MSKNIVHLTFCIYLDVKDVILILLLIIISAFLNKLSAVLRTSRGLCILIIRLLSVKQPIIAG